MGVSAAFFPRFKKVIALVGSEREGERRAAADQAYRLCEENDLSFMEAMEGAFGGSVTDNEDLLRQIDELEADNRQLAEAVTVLNAQRQAISEDAGDRLLEKAWSYPQVRLIALLIFAIGGSILASDLSHEFAKDKWLGYVAMLVRWGVIGETFYLLWEWGCAEFSNYGLGVLTMRSLIVLGGLYGALSAFVDSHDEFGAALWLAVAAALTLTNVCRWLADRLAHSKREPFRLLRSWFA